MYDRIDKFINLMSNGEFVLFLVYVNLISFIVYLCLFICWSILSSPTELYRRLVYSGNLIGQSVLVVINDKV